jgi:hypothetical protein
MHQLMKEEMATTRSYSYLVLELEPWLVWVWDDVGGALQGEDTSMPGSVSSAGARDGIHVKEVLGLAGAREARLMHVQHADCALAWRA